MKLDDGKELTVHIHSELREFIGQIFSVGHTQLDKLAKKEGGYKESQYIEMSDYFLSLMADPLLLMSLTTRESEIETVSGMDTESLTKHYRLLLKENVDQWDDFTEINRREFGHDGVMPTEHVVAYLFLQAYLAIAERIFDNTHFRMTALAYIDRYEGKSSDRYKEDTLVYRPDEEDDSYTIPDIRKHFFEATKIFYRTYFFEGILAREEKITDPIAKTAFVADQISRLEVLKERSNANPLSEYLLFEYGKEDTELFSQVHKYWMILRSSRFHDYILEGDFYHLHRLGKTAGLFEALKLLQSRAGNHPEGGNQEIAKAENTDAKTDGHGEDNRQKPKIVRKGRGSESDAQSDKISHDADMEQVYEFFSILTQKGIPKTISEENLRYIIGKHFDPDDLSFQDTEIEIKLPPREYAIVRRHIYRFFNLFGGRPEEYTKIINERFGKKLNANNFSKDVIGYTKHENLVTSFKKRYNLEYR